MLDHIAKLSNYGTEAASWLECELPRDIHEKTEHLVVDLASVIPKLEAKTKEHVDSALLRH